MGGWRNEALSGRNTCNSCSGRIGAVIPAQRKDAGGFSISSYGIESFWIEMRAEAPLEVLRTTWLFWLPDGTAFCVSMKILLTLPGPLFPADTGGKIRSLNIFSRLAQRAEIHAVS